MASRSALCAAMFAAADFGHRGVLREQFRQLDNFQNELGSRVALMKKDYALELEPLLGWFGWDSVPDIRFRVNVLRLMAARTLGDGGTLLASVDEECRARMESREIPIVAWDARTTWFDKRVGGPIDASKGLKTYLFYDWSASDLFAADVQLRILANVRKLVLE
jgi:hypothetical protein